MTATLARVSFRALGTTVAVVVDTAGHASWGSGASGLSSTGAVGPAATAAAEAVRAEVAAIDLACSRFRPDSELSRLNAAGGRPMPASALLLDAVEVALRAARLTGGLVDPTIGRALRLLGYDRDFAAIDRSSSDQVVTLFAGPVAGWRTVTCDRPSATISLPRGVELDLGATAKALAADRAAAAAARACGCGVLVSLGGDIAVAGAIPDGGWPVRVADDHAAPADQPGQTISIAGGGLATSGTTVRRWQRGGVDVHHLIDPSTGTSARVTWRTASTAAVTCVDANTASTAAIILGPAAPAWLAERRLPSRLVAADGGVTYVAGWPEQ